MYIDFPDNSFNEGNSLVVYVDKCNMKCKDCDYKTSLKQKKLRKVNLDELDKYIKDNYKFIDNIILCGGEPTLNQKLIDYVINTKLKCIIYTNSLNLFNVNKFYKVYIDVKGSTEEEIIEYTGINKHYAHELINMYKSLSKENNVYFRVYDDKLYKFINSLNVEYDRIIKYDKVYFGG